MTPRFTIAARLLAPFLAAELAVFTVQWFLVPEESWLTYGLGAVWAVVLPLFAAARLTRASFTTGTAVLSALLFAIVGLVWATCAAALGYAGAEWQHYLLGVLISTVMIGVPLQLAAAYVGTRHARSTSRTATQL